MQRQHLSVYGTSGPGPGDEARRIVRKIGEELGQTAADAPNIIALSFFGTSPSQMARDLAFRDLWAGGLEFGVRPDGTRIDLGNLTRTDSIFEFSRDRLTTVHLNPTCEPAFRLLATTREHIRQALSAPMVIR